MTWSAILLPENPPPWPRHVPSSRAVEQFLAMGWTAEDWQDLDQEMTDRAGGQVRGVSTGYGVSADRVTNIREWLRMPPESFAAPMTTGTVRETFATHGVLTSIVLDAYAAGASTRFVDAFFTAPGQFDVRKAWAITSTARLSEPAAVGWALTGRLCSAAGPGVAEENENIVDVRVTPWTDLFGSNAYLHILAGFTFAEAIELKDTGVHISEEQLRVMVALAGVVLPAGI